MENKIYHTSLIFWMNDLIKSHSTTIFHLPVHFLKARRIGEMGGGGLRKITKFTLQQNFQIYITCTHHTDYDFEVWQITFCPFLWFFKF